jgi:4'-phosphopantetheinyl transferase
MSPDCGWPLLNEPTTLENDAVHVYCASLDRSDADMLSAVLSDDEQRRAGRFRFDQDRRHFVVAKGLLRVLVGRQARREPATVRFSYGPHGKPTLAGSVDGRALCFNLAHSHGLVVYALAWDRELGIDVEHVRRMDDAEGIAAHFFSPKEAAALAGLPAEARQLAFFHCWTQKEAYVKATGGGLAVALSRFAVSLAPGEPARLLGVEGQASEAARWQLRTLSPAPGYVGALAVEGTGWQLLTWRMR